MDTSVIIPREPLAMIDENSMDASVPAGLSPVKQSQPLRARPSLPIASENTHTRLGLFAIADQQSTHDHIIACPKSAALLLGRARVAEIADDDDALMSSETQDVVGGVPVHRIALPNTARHVSRDHCILYHTPFGASWAVKILGQNGLIVDGTRHRAGSILRLVSGQTIIDFFGFRCLFVGANGLFAGKEKSSPFASLHTPQQDGRSPRKSAVPQWSKPRISLGTSEPVSHSEMQGEDTTVIEKATSAKLIGNVHKRPLGAPLSPPTSSPAPFNLSSSPQHRSAQHRLLASSSPPLDFGVADNVIQDDGEDDEDDDDYEEPDESSRDRAASPTLQRRHAGVVVSQHDDGDVLMQGANLSSKSTSNKREESEDEASQALPTVRRPVVVAPPRKTIKIIRRKVVPVSVERKVVPVAEARKATPTAVDRKAAPVVEERKASINADESRASPSPANTPRRARDSKRVKFNVSTVQDEAASPAATLPSALTQKSTAVQPATMIAVQQHYRALVAVLAQSYDIQGQLAGAIVFHRTATISGTEAVRSVLSSNPGLMQGEVGPELKQTEGGPSALERGSILDGWTRESIIESGLVKAEEADKERVETWQRKAWREQLEVFLLEGDCFGIIQRAGKDASGQPLECWYYYDKEHDPDTQRAANLGAFAKPMRAALKTHKPIFWRKSAYGTTSDDVKALQQQGFVETSSSSALPTESQVGSSGSTLNAALLTSASPSALSMPRLSHGGSNARSSAWEETQFEETEQTWDKEGDMDFDVGAAGGGAGNRRMKRSKK